MLTRKQLQDMPIDSVFAHGIIENSEDGLFMTNNNIGRKLLWVAKRGGIDDWAIYVHWADKGIDFVRDRGDKITRESYIKKLVPCDAEAFARYRY